MVAIAVAPFVLKDMIFQVGTDSYEQHVSSVAFTPETETVKWQGGTPAAAFTDTTNPSWTCTIECAQDWVTPNSLVQYLLTNAGTAKIVIFKPQGTTTGKPIFTATLMIAPPPIGGAINAVQTASITMGVVGAPVKTAAP